MLIAVRITAFLMIQIFVENNFTSWREAARRCLQNDILPEAIRWTREAENNLFQTDFVEANDKRIFKIPADFFPLAETALCFDDAEKFALLYRILFRLVHENKNLLHIESDDDMRRARLMEKAIYRDVHKFHAFVRFREIELEEVKIYVAWHEPHHFTVERAAPFFARRFGAMRFSILTPKGCAHWNLEELRFSDAVAKLDLPDDETEDFWLVYYRSIFNPFRLKTRAMKKEMPVRHWRTLPEAVLIPELIRRGKEAEKKKRF